MKESVTEHLAELGFSGAEAEAYLAVLGEPGATGYRIARLVGKPAPNTYKALDGLNKKGAIVVDESGRGRTYTALPVAEFFEGLKRRLDSMRSHLEEELRGLTAGAVEGGIFRLNTLDQVYGRVRTMLREAKSMVLIDIFPKPLAHLKADIEAAAKRGVRVWIMVYEPGEVKGCEIIAPEKTAPQLLVWKADWLNVVADSREVVYSLLKKDESGVHRAVWIRDPYLAMQAFSGAFHEFALVRAGQLLSRNRSREELGSELRRIGRTYVTDECFYDVFGPWVNREKIRELRRRADRIEAERQRKDKKESRKEEK
jgi:sugar-specific transcriptional regulator TrmB